tara:strand:- start:34 stop:291 length:258 start_codon:yes stop_codon:yes gene_type:complete
MIEDIMNKRGLEKVAIDPMQDSEYLAWEKQVFNRLVDYLNEPDIQFGQHINALTHMKITWAELRDILIEHEPRQPEPLYRQGRLF